MDNVTQMYRTNTDYDEASTEKNMSVTDWVLSNTTKVPSVHTFADFDTVSTEKNQPNTDWLLINTSESEQTTSNFVNQTSYTPFAFTESANNSDDNSYNYDYGDEDYDYDYGDDYMYAGYAFERPFYLYIWEILVIFTSLVNIVVIVVLLRRKMRNPTNILLATIAVTDSLTGLVTLPTYIMVYLRFDPLKETDYTNYNDSYNYQYEYNVTTPEGETHEGEDGYKLTKNLCRGFMISKYFLSNSFHTMSIFLTLFLGIQRYISIAYPYKSQSILNMNNVLICCVVIVVVSPIMHIYHLTDERAFEGLCQWELKDDHCGGGCIYLWIAFFIRHLLPCVALVTFTILFILQLRVGERHLRRMDSTKSQLSRRSEENRRISLIVTGVVIVFLIPEVPYGIFLLYNTIDKTANKGNGIRLETNRAIHMVYELFLVLSFHANFYIYTFFNRRFRKTLHRTFFKPIRRLIGDPSRLSISQTSSSFHRPTTRKTDTESTRNKFEMETILTNGKDQAAMKDTKLEDSSLIGKDMTTFQSEINTEL